MNVILFQPRFEPLIRCGAKWQTCRLHRRDGKPRARVAETVSLRVWSGLPYRSKQREIAQAVITEVESIQIERNGVSFGDGTLRAWWVGVGTKNEHYLEYFAKRDGFDSFGQLVEWFQKTHGLPFSGSCIEWRVVK